MKRTEDGLDEGAIPSTSTISTSTYRTKVVKRNRCAYDGGELGSTDGIGKWRTGAEATIIATLN